MQSALSHSVTTTNASSSSSSLHTPRSKSPSSPPPDSSRQHQDQDQDQQQRQQHDDSQPADPDTVDPEGRVSSDTQRPDFPHTLYYTSTLMSGVLGKKVPPGTLYVRALYDYEADDPTSLDFREGDTIQVITQLESGWWDGVMGGVRGWFPSNYCEVITRPEELPEGAVNVRRSLSENEAHDDEAHREDDDDRHTSATDDTQDAGGGGASGDGGNTSGGGDIDDDGDDDEDNSGADFWIPQATGDLRLYYFNTMTGEKRTEMPLEPPSSLNETGPRNRMHVNIPDRTRLPPEMMAGGLTQAADDGDDDDDDDRDEDHDAGIESDATSQSELDNESIMLASRHSAARRMMYHHQPSVISSSIARTRSMDSINRRPSSLAKARNDSFTIPSAASRKPPITSTTSFTTPTFSLPRAATIPHSFFDDGITPPLTWDLLIRNMQTAILRYRRALESRNRAEFVARVEDISDYLRLLLAIGSGTTDNHSGNPSIISSNKALYPHYRDVMSKFSKLVLSSHVAAADWAPPESIQKCIVEAGSVSQGLLNFAEVARQQRGEQIPRLFPGFIIGSARGGSWQNNGLGPRDAVAANFMDDDEGPVETNAILNVSLLESIEEHRRALVANLRDLEKMLTVKDRVITPSRHEFFGNSVCYAGGRVLDLWKPWITAIESADLASLADDAHHTPLLAELAVQKQSLYDNLSDLMVSCQNVGGPLADEWSEIRGQSLEERLEYVRQCARVLEMNSVHINSTLQILSERVQVDLCQQQRQQQQVKSAQAQSRALDDQASSPPRGGLAPRADMGPSDPPHTRSDSRGLAARTSPLATTTTMSLSPPPVGGDSADVVANMNSYRKGDYTKMKKFFGEDPAPSSQVDETLDFLRLDYEHELSIDYKAQPPTLKGGSLFALVEQLTRHDKLEPNFNNTFLLTYRSFTTARELFELLVQRFAIQPPGRLSPADFETWRDRKQKIIRFRVVNILKNWFDGYWMEDQSPETKQLIRDVYKFAKDTVRSTDTPGAAPLMAVLDQRLTGKEAGGKRMIQTLNQHTPTPIIPKSMKKLKFLDIDSREFARQLTIIESRLYGRIKPTECLNKTWQKKGEGDMELAPNVRTLILHSNQMTNWVAEMILAQQDVRKRVVVIRHFVSVAEQCWSLNNFSTLTSIMSALGTAPIARLKRTWDQVPPRILTTLEDMRGLMASTKNFGHYREALHQSNPPCIPFFGVYLTDLTFIEDGMPSIIKKSNMINFAKRAKTAEVIQDIQQYQNVNYSLQPVPDLQEYILSNMQAAGDVHEMYEKSLQMEPREREDEKIVRVLAESGFL